MKPLTIAGITLVALGLGYLALKPSAPPKPLGVGSIVRVREADLVGTFSKLGGQAVASVEVTALTPVLITCRVLKVTAPDGTSLDWSTAIPQALATFAPDKVLS